jgi:hypothetical protein
LFPDEIKAAEAWRREEKGNKKLRKEFIPQFPQVRNTFRR